MRDWFVLLNPTQHWRAGLLSAVPVGLNLERVVFTQTVKPGRPAQPGG